MLRRRGGRRRGMLLAAFLLVYAVTGARSVETAWVPLVPKYPVPPYVQCLLEVATGELGYVEGRDGTTKYGEWAGDPQAEWCAEFLCWCVGKVDLELDTQLLDRVFPLYTSSNTGRNWFLREGRYIARNGYVPDWGSQWWSSNGAPIEKNSYIPQPGDWVFLSYNSSGDTSHVALVECCECDDDGLVRVCVIEGNNPDRVQRASYPLSDWRILGYGTVRSLADLVLRPGSSGQKILDLQLKLSALGWMDESGCNGTYHQQTADAVRAFQKHAGHSPTGIANRQTQLDLSKCFMAWRRGHVDSWAVDDSP